jgi:predicted kinase
MRLLRAIALWAPYATALTPYSKQITSLKPDELQSWLARDVGRRRQELQALAWLGRAHRVLPNVFDGVFTIDRYANVPWYACDGVVRGTLRTGTAIVARGVPVSFSLADERMTITALGCDVVPSPPPPGATALEEQDAERLCQQLVASKRVLIDAIERVVFDVLEPALAADPTFEAAGDAVSFEPERDLFAREGSSEKWLQCVSEYYFAEASLQEVAPAGNDMRFLFYYDTAEPLNSEDLRMNVNPEVICCKFPEVLDGASRSSFSCGTALASLLVVVLLLADARTTPPRARRRRRAPVSLRRGRLLVFAATCCGALQPLTTPPRLIILAGLPGSGKSSLAAALERRGGWAVVNQDTLGNRRKCEAACARAFDRGDRVVVDRCNHDRSQRAHWTRLLAAAGGGQVVAVWLTTPVDACVDRVLARPAHPTLAGPGAEDVVRRFEGSFAAPALDEVDAVVELAPTDDYDAVAAALDPP